MSSPDSAQVRCGSGSTKATTPTGTASTSIPNSHRRPLCILNDSIYKPPENSDSCRQTVPNLKIGICGENGGTSASVKFCHRAGLDYVSCSPFRIPIAKLAAAQAALEEKGQARSELS